MDWQEQPAWSRLMPSGLTRLDKPLVMPDDAHGVQLAGWGPAPPSGNSYWAPRYVREATVLAGAFADQALIQAHGSHWAIQALALAGWRTRNARDEARFQPGTDVGIHAYQADTFNGSKATIDRVAFTGFNACILIGQRGADARGNDNLTMRKVWADRCGSLLEVASVQACTTHVHNWHARNVDQVVLAAGGGDVTLRDGDVDHGATLLRVIGPGKSVGSGNGFFAVEGVKVDPAQGGEVGTLTLLDVHHQSAVVHATMRDLRLPPTRTAVRARLVGGRQRLLLSDIKNLPADTRFRLAGGARITIEHTDLRCDPADMLTTGSRGTLIIRDCWRETHAKGGAHYKYIHHARIGE